MELKYNIITVSEILSQLGKNDVSEHIDILVRYNHSMYLDHYYGFKVTIQGFLNNYSIGDDMTSYQFLREYIDDEDKLKNEKFYSHNDDDIDLVYCLNNAKNQNIIMSIVDNINNKKHSALFSDRFIDKLMDILHKNVFDSSVERDLFKMEIGMRLQRCNFNQTFDRNFDAKQCDDEFTVSYMPKGKKTVMTSNNRWQKENRVQAKFVKAMKKIPFRFKYSDRFFEQLNNYVVAYYLQKFTITEVSGEDIVKYYHENSYLPGDNSSLGGSCMRYSSCSEWIKFYAENPSNVSMVIALNNDGYLCGRAILWTADCGTKIMDRIYGNDVIVSKFKKYAMDNEYIHKLEQSYSNGEDWVGEGGERFTKRFEITVNNIFKMPYMDTFCHTDSVSDDTMVLNNYDGNYSFRDTDGCREAFGEDEEDDDYVTCTRSGNRISYDEAVCIHGDYYDSYYCVWAEDIDEHVLSEDAVLLEYKGYYVSEDAEISYVDCEGSDRYSQYMYTDDTIELANGDVCPDYEAMFNELDGEYYFVSGEDIELIVTISGDTVTTGIMDCWYEDTESIVSAVKNWCTEEVLEITSNGEIIFKKQLDEVTVND